jgi:hypothetical protein
MYIYIIKLISRYVTYNTIHTFKVLKYHSNKICSSYKNTYRCIWFCR